MLAELGYDSLDALVDAAVPTRSASTRRSRSGAGVSRAGGAARGCAARRAQRACSRRSSASATTARITPPVIARNVLENPAWYTAYTPYQPEISQGRLEALLNFQTMVADLTGMEIANASLLDEGTAAAEAMAMMAPPRTRNGRRRVLVDADCHPADDRRRRARAPSRSASTSSSAIPNDDLDPTGVFGVLLQYPGSSGASATTRAIVERCARRRARWSRSRPTCSRSCCCVPPGEIGADIVVGSAQRFGVPLDVRRSARGVPRDARRAQAHAARPAGRRVGRRRRAARAAPRAADARAAHPPREGDEQHLHRAGAARGDRRPLRRRTTVPTGSRAIAGGCTGSRAILADGPRVRRLRGRARRVLRHDQRARARPRRGDRRRRARARGVNLGVVDGDTVGITLDETTTDRGRRRRCGRRSA